MANPHRGEMAFTLDGATYTLRPDFEAIVAIEEALDCSIEDLVRRLEGGALLKVTELAVIIGEGMKAHGRAVGREAEFSFKRQRLAELIVKEGKLKVAAAVPSFLVAAITGGVTEGNEPAPKS